jgi:hypothetical protein
MSEANGTLGMHREIDAILKGSNKIEILLLAFSERNHSITTLVFHSLRTFHPRLYCSSPLATRATDTALRVRQDFNSFIIRSWVPIMYFV